MNENGLERLLRQIDPVDESELDSWEKSGAADASFERIVRANEQGPRILRPRRRRTYKRTAVAALGAGTLLVATAAVFALTSAPTSDPLSVGCYTQLDQDANAAIISLVNANANITPAAVCASRWEAAFGTPPPHALVTCVVSGGGTGVFPNEAGLPPEEACRSIGAVLPTGGAPFGGLSAEEVRVLAADLESRHAQIAERPECAGNITLKAEVQESLAILQADSWKVEDLTSSTRDWTFPDGTTETVPVPLTADGQRCSDYAIDALGSTVILVNGWPELPTR